MLYNFCCNTHSLSIQNFLKYTRNYGLCIGYWDRISHWGNPVLGYDVLEPVLHQAEVKVW